MSTKASLFKMYSLLIQLVLLFALKTKFTQTAICNNISSEADRPSDIAKYISALLESEIRKDHSVNQFIALIRFEINNKSEVFDDIATEVFRSNIQHLAFVQRKFCFKPYPPFLIHTSSIIVVSTDLADTVSKTLLVKLKK